MAAFIRCLCHLDPDSLDADQFAKEYGRAKYISEVVYGTKFS